MSYAVFGDRSDVHVERGDQGEFECRACSFGNLRFETPAQMLVHLENHRNKGHKVPKVAIQRLTRELLEGWDI